MNESDLLNFIHFPSLIVIKHGRYNSNKNKLLSRPRGDLMVKMADVVIKYIEKRKDKFKTIRPDSNFETLTYCGYFIVNVTMLQFKIYFPKIIMVTNMKKILV